MNKDLIKYGLIALGAYLIYQYIQKNGGISGLFGTTAAAGTVPIVPGATTGVPSLTNILPNAPATPTQPAAQVPAQVPILDMTGLVVAPDINDSLTGTVKLNGIPTRLSIITASGQVYDSMGQEVTAVLQAQGVNIVALRTAFANAGGVGISGLGAMLRFTPSWLM
jgi:hypothetical protein